MRSSNEKIRLCLYVLTILVEGYCRSQVWKNFIKGEYGAIETKGGSLLSLLIRKVIVAPSGFCNLHEEREQLTQIRQSGLWRRFFT
jgi:cytochrome c oxidase subunit 3